MSQITRNEKRLLIAYTAAFVAALLLIAATLAVLAAYKFGIKHAIEDSVIYTVDIYDPDDPESSAFGEYDQAIYIVLDDNTYVHGMYQG